MVETLTESFCERCGTRYEFSAPTRLNPLRKTRGFLGGLKNYLTSQDALSDAMGDAMRSEEDQLAAAQLEAFHQSFNFCINCRQYTCINCWNDGEGRCRTCAPIPGTDDLIERIAASYHGTAASAVIEAGVTEPALEPRPGLDAWPSIDAPAVAAERDAYATAAWPEADPVAATSGGDASDVSGTEAEPVVAESEPEPEPVIAVAEPEPKPEPEPVVAEAEAEPEPVVAAAEPVDAAVEPERLPTTDAPIAATAEEEEEEEEEVATASPVELEPDVRPLRVVSWEDDAAYEVADPEPMLAEATTEPATAALEPVAADLEVEPEPEPVAAEIEAEPQPVAAEIEPEEEPVAATFEPEEEPVAATFEPEPGVEVEPVAADVEVELEPEPVAADIEAEAEPVAATFEPEPGVEVEPVAADLEVEPQPEAEPRARRIRPISETILQFPDPRATPQATDADGQAAEDDAPEVAARRAQLDLLGLGDAGEGRVQPEWPAVLPYRSRGAGVTPAELAAIAARGSFWEASAREVADAAANIGVQNCGQCGLSLSANARFCRRCGTRQARSA